MVFTAFFINYNPRSAFLSIAARLTKGDLSDCAFFLPFFLFFLAHGGLSRQNNRYLCAFTLAAFDGYLSVVCIYYFL